MKNIVRPDGDFARPIGQSESRGLKLSGKNKWVVPMGL